MYKEENEKNKCRNKCEENFDKKCDHKCEEVKEGTSKCYEKEYDVCGKKEVIVNKHYHNNHYTRYNDIVVTDRHFVKNFVKDCNRVHHKVETIDLGTKYCGAHTIEEKKCEWKEPEKKCYEPKDCKYEKEEKEEKRYFDMCDWLKEEEKKEEKEEYGKGSWCDIY